MNAQTIRCNTQYKKCQMSFAVAVFDGGMRSVVSGEVTTVEKNKVQKTKVEIYQSVSGPTTMLVLEALGSRLVGPVEVRAVNGSVELDTTR